MREERKKRLGKRERKKISLSFLLSLFSLFSLVACGFSPVYGHHEHSAAVSSEMNSVAIENIPDRSGQMLRNDLIDRMYGSGRPTETHYVLAVKLNITMQDLGIQADTTSTRTMMDAIASYTLQDKSGKDLLKGTAHSVTSYNTIENQYATIVSNADANERTTHELSEQIINRLSLYFAERAETNSAPTNVSGPQDGHSPAALIPTTPITNQ